MSVEVTIYINVYPNLKVGPIVTATNNGNPIICINPNLNFNF